MHTFYAYFTCSEPIVNVKASEEVGVKVIPMREGTVVLAVPVGVEASEASESIRRALAAAGGAAAEYAAYFSSNLSVWDCCSKIRRAIQKRRNFASP